MVHSKHLESVMKLSCSLVAVLALLAGGVAQSKAGILHGSDIITDELLTINTSTGVATSVGALGFGGVEGLAFDPNTNTLYGSDIGTGELLTIDTSTGVGTSVGALGFGSVGGLAFDPNTNTLYGSDFFADELVTINTSTGAATSVGPLGFSSVQGLAVVPEPSTVILAAIGLVGLAAFDWQRRKRSNP